MDYSYILAGRYVHASPPPSATAPCMSQTGSTRSWCWVVLDQQMLEQALAPARCFGVLEKEEVHIVSELLKELLYSPIERGIPEL